MRSSLVVAAVVVSLPAATRAAPFDTFFDPLSMDRLTPETTVGVDFGYEVWDEPPGVNSIDAFGLNLAGHYVSPSGAGGYLTLPLSYVAVDSLLFDESELAIGNLEAGAMYAKRFRNDVSLVVHGGIALPTADDDGVGALQAYASVPRYGDLVQRWPDSTWLRLGVSPMGRSGILFWRADLGLDLALDDDNAAGDISPVLRLNVGGGLDLGGAQLLGELVTNVVDSAGDDTASTLTLGARFVSGSLRPGVGLLFPLGFGDGSQEDFIDFAIILSLTGRVGPR